MSHNENITIIKTKAKPCVECGTETYMQQKFFFYNIKDGKRGIVNLYLRLCDDCYIKEREA